MVATFKLTGRIFPLWCLVYPGVSFTVQRHRTAQIMLKGRLLVRPFLVGKGHSCLVLGPNSHFLLAGDFEIGQGVYLCAAPGATLDLGGRHTSTGSGVTADSIVMAERSLTIGKDVSVAWGCTIPDSDCPPIEGVPQALPTVIGDRVWLGHGVSVLKGAHVPAGCVVAARSVVGMRDYPENALLAGIPAIVRRESVKWSR